MKIIQNCFFALILITHFSCKEKNFEFKVINSTSFDIKTFNLDWCDGDNQISLEPNESSEIIILSSKTKGLGSLCFGAMSIISPSGITYDNQSECGFSKPKDDFSTSKINKITILENPENDSTFCDKNFFIFKYE